MSDFPKDFIDTGKKLQGVKLGISEIIPLCRRNFLMRGVHKQTGQPGWFAFCKKSGELEHVGPYKTAYEAMEILVLTKGCDNCQYNIDERRGKHLEIIKEIETEINEKFKDTHIFQILKGPAQEFVKNRVFVDINFKRAFGTRFFRSLPDDSIASLDIITPATDLHSFSVKIQALAGLIDRIHTKEVRGIIKTKKRDKFTGSISILEKILEENAPSYPRHIISNFRNLQSLRSKLYPTHSTASKIILILENFGISKYPPDDWEEAYVQILRLCNSSMKSLIEVLNEIGKNKS
jgi:hypothetical protein